MHISFFFCLYFVPFCLNVAFKFNATRKQYPAPEGLFIG